MATNGSSTRSIAVRVPNELFEAVDGMAEHRGVSKSELMRELLESRTVIWRLERQVEDVVEEAPSLDELHRFLEEEVARERELQEQVGESIASLERWLRYVRKQRQEAIAQVKGEVAGGLRAGTDPRQLQLEEE